MRGIIVLLLVVGCAAPKPVAPPPRREFTGLAAGLHTMEEVKARMKKVALALGVKCDHCHDVADFAAPTPNKRIANLMAERFVGKLEPRIGGEFFCGSCHQGRATFLDRSDQETLKRWMQVNFVDKLRMKGGASIECDTCHQGARYKFLPRTL
jgi:cytochrome c7-like protein